MDFRTFDTGRAAKLDDPARFRFVSREGLLSHLGVAPERVVADPGGGTGFFIDEIVPHVNTLYVVDVQVVMHGYHREKDTSGNVEFVAADVASLPFDNDRLGAAFSMMTYHEFVTDEALAELARVVHPDDTAVMVDQSISDSGEDGPSRDERLGPGDAVSALEAIGLTATRGETRRETFVCIARR